MTHLLEEAVFRLSIRAHRGQQRSDIANREATFSTEKYDEWRDDDTTVAIEQAFDWERVKGKRVLEFGCGAGPLARMCAERGAASVIGADLSKVMIARAKDRYKDSNLPIEFICEPDAARISLPDNSVDIIFCFDVMEHIMEYEAIAKEWRRVLAPGGRILIWWQAWRHPYGHHLYTMIPLPWVHMLLSDAGLFRVATRIYEHPDFRPRFWHFDEHGQKKKDMYRKTKLVDLNKLTIGKFDTLMRRNGLTTQRKRLNPFGGQRFALLKKVLARSPWPDFFCSSVVYELEKPS